MDRKFQLAAEVIRLVGKEIVIKRGLRRIPHRYLPYIGTAFVIYEVVMIGRQIYMAIPRKDELQVSRQDLAEEQD